MTLPDLMIALCVHGATLTLHYGDRIKVRAPAPLPDALLDAAWAQKADIVAALQDRGAKAPRRAAELVATLPQASCPGGCGRQTAYGGECPSCRLAVGGGASGPTFPTGHLPRYALSTHAATRAATSSVDTALCIARDDWRAS
jgi:hypothetical protein